MIAAVPAFDPAPHPLLASITSMEAVIITAFVLMKQNRADEKFRCDTLQHPVDELGQRLPEGN